MRIAQITDLHIGFEPDNPDEQNARRLAAVLARLAELQPDLVLATGDLTEHGDGQGYARLRALLDASGLRFRFLVGNHDCRAAFAAVFPGWQADDGFVHHAADIGGLRIVALDTLEEGRHSGAFCSERARWLEARLAEAPDRPTLVALHHPPVETGIAWMTAPRNAPWAERLAAVIARHPQVRLLVAGHIHRTMATTFAGRPLLVCPASAPQLALDLAPIDPAVPDGRPMVVDEPPGFALHVWDGVQFVTHFGLADGADVIVRHDTRMAQAIAPILAEHAADRAGGPAPYPAA
ncbi:MAG: phosphodiesterase [Thermaurantiacus tibetensis]|uniref:phosphodiesterase n=1 Tax=Thermaurantiacus tibetensis TaxID=2759035 RepID=UPI00188ECBCB|nr:phosphodiesterase [Thermaurantiacus tibetensis]